MKITAGKPEQPAENLEIRRRKTMKHTNCDKLILAVLQGDEYRDTVTELNRHGFYATVLNSTGGFLKKQSVTIMVGLNHEHLEEALEILKRHGKRTETVLQPVMLGDGDPALNTDSIPVPVSCGGVVLFVLDVDRNERY